MDFSKNKNFINSLKYLSILLLVIASYGVGWLSGHEKIKFQQGFIPAINNQNSGKTDFSLLWRVWDDLNKKYDGKIDQQKMIYGAIDGMVHSLEDPYTYFMDPVMTKAFNEEVSGTIYGIGAEIGIKDGQITIVAPLPGGPAQKSGLLPGDIVKAINGTTTTGMTIDQAVFQIRGKEGTNVTLDILRDDNTLKVIITRERIDIVSVYWEIKEKIGILHIKNFNNDTVGLVNKALADFEKAKVKGIVLDMRNNPGGLLDASIKVASQFVNGEVVIEKSGGKIIKKHKSTGIGKFTDKKVPIAVLVNKGTASASEIVAGAIQDHKRGILFGENTFGKGSVQEVKYYFDKSSLRVTMAHWFTPKGNNINDEGLKPDKEIKVDSSKLHKEDEVLKKALEYLNTKI